MRPAKLRDTTRPRASSRHGQTSFYGRDGDSGSYLRMPTMSDDIEAAEKGPAPGSGARDTRETLEQFDRFVKVMNILCGVCIVVGLFAIAGPGKLCLPFASLVCMLSFLFSQHLVRWILLKDDGTAEMRHISNAIKRGSEGFLYTQYSTIASMAILVSIVLGMIYAFRQPNPHVQLSTTMASFITSFAFLLGSLCSGLAGYLGVWVSVRVNIRVAAAAARHSYSDALQLSFRGGAVSSVLSAAMCITGLSVLYLVLYLFFVGPQGLQPEQVPMLLSGYGFGASFVALFMQLGGGIYTKAADVGADMVGKIEASIPEDDPRNPAVIADLVGDNVGDCAGSMADVFESIAAEMIGTMILGGLLAKQSNLESSEGYIFFPLVVHALDLIVSSIGIVLVKSSGNEDPLTTMKRSYGICMAAAVVCFTIVTRLMLYTPVAPSAWWNYSLCGYVGMGCSYLLVIITQYYTDYAYGPVKKIASASTTGHGTNIIAGISVGMESTALPALVICVSLLLSFFLGSTSGLEGLNAGLFGTACATMGMLCTAVFVLSMNNFGPIADNAGGIVEMSQQSESVRKITDRLDAVGNVTKAATKGYAVGGSALACFVLFQAFLDEINEYSSIPFRMINLAQVEVIVGGLLGIALVFLFTGWTIDAVGRTAQDVVWEVRRQLQDPRIMEGTVAPDYKSCVSIVTRAALREMIRPALLALTVPILVGVVFRYIGEATSRPLLGVEVLASLLIFGTLTGLLMAVFLDNSGGAWDNAKKLVEANGGKNSETHNAAITGDTVGDPFKDTAGPSLHVIITTMSTTALVIGPLFLASGAISPIQ